MEGKRMNLKQLNAASDNEYMKALAPEDKIVIYGKSERGIVVKAIIGREGETSRYVDGEGAMDDVVWKASLEEVYELLYTNNFNSYEDGVWEGNEHEWEEVWEALADKEVVTD
jgi:hypothetical protein